MVLPILPVVALGGVLHQFFNRSEKLIKTGQQAGNNLLVEAGQLVRFTVQNLQSAYSASLQETVDKVDGVTKERLEQIGELLTQLETSGNQLIDRVTDNGEQLIQRVQQIMNTAPFSNTQPQCFSSPLLL